jgi:arginine utilization regulatory protein
MEAFRAYDWPGNVRELEHFIEAMLNVAGEARVIGIEMLPDHFGLSPKISMGEYDSRHISRFQDFFHQAEAGEPGGLVSLRDKEKAMISNALSVAGGNVTRAARLLDISRQLLAYKMKKHGLDRSCFK